MSKVGAANAPSVAHAGGSVVAPARVTCTELDVLRELVSGSRTSVGDVNDARADLGVGCGVRGTRIVVVTGEGEPPSRRVRVGESGRRV